MLTFAWRYPRATLAACNAAFYDVVGTAQSGVLLRAPVRQLPLNDGRLGFSVTWSPRETLRPETGTEFRYVVECFDNVVGITWRQKLPGSQAYRPAPSILSRIWTGVKDSPEWLKALLAVGALTGVWVCMLVGLYVFAPTKLVDLNEALPGPKSLDQVAEAADKPTAGLAKLFRLLGVASLLWLGTSRRPLDAWCTAKAPIAENRFNQLKIVRDRQIALDLPVCLDGHPPEPAWTALDLLFRQPSIGLLITGAGGTGKTTLACQLARRMLARNGTALGGFTCLPLIIERDLKETEAGENLVRFLAGVLRVTIGAPRVSTALTEALLRSGRVLVIVDGLSERDEITRQAFDPGQPTFPIMRLVVTSRDPTRGNMGASLETTEIPPDNLYTFLEHYIARVTTERRTHRVGQADIHEACAQLKRLLRDTPTTPLFASIWAEEVILGNADTAQRIQNPAELIDAYVERLLSPVVQKNATLLTSLRMDLSTIAIRELGGAFTPGWLTRTQILDALVELSEEIPERRLSSLLDSRLVESDTPNTELMRVALDPIAEHLVARFYTEELKANSVRWRAFLAEFRQRGCPLGFLDSLRACLDHRVYGREVPSDIRRLLLSRDPLGQIEVDGVNDLELEGAIDTSS